MKLPIRQRNITQMVKMNYPLLPKIEALDPNAIVMRGIDSMLVPFASSLDFKEDLSPSIEKKVWAQTSPASGRFTGVKSIDPQSYFVRVPGEETGQGRFLVHTVASIRFPR